MPVSDALKRLDRGGDRSLTQQIVDIFVAAIADGELAPGGQLPPTRELARIAGVNQLTASRAYRRLQQLGLVTSGVGRGTFVRGTAGRAPDEHRDHYWQTYALPTERESYPGRIVGELVRHAVSDELISLSAGYPSSEVIPHAILDAAAIATLERGGVANYGYGPVEGTGELREQLAGLGRERGLCDTADEIVVTTGARQGLTLAARAVLRAGDVVACESPTFMGIIEAARSTGATLVPVPVDEGGFSVDALEQLLRAHEVKLVVLQPRLQNPTARDLAGERRERLIDLAARHGFFVLEDAVYADLRYEGPDPGPLRALDPGHVIYVDSLSKTVAPGLRTGWIAASGPVLDRIISEKRSDDTHSPTFTQEIAARFLADGHYPAQLARARMLYRDRRDAAVGALESEMAGLATFAYPAGGGQIWLTLDQAIGDEQLYRAALAAGVSYVPGPAMLIEHPYATHMRISFGSASPDELREGIHRIAATVRAQRAAPLHRNTLPIA